MSKSVDLKKKTILHLLFLVCAYVYIIAATIWLGRQSSVNTEKENLPGDGGMLENGEDWLTQDDFIATPMTGQELYDSLGETLEIICGGYRGSGFVIEKSETEIIIASASHLVANGVEADIILSDGSTLTGEVIKLSEQYDIGYIRIDAGDVNASQRELLAAKITANQQYYDELADGDYAMLPHQDGTYSEGTIASPYLFEADVNAHVMKLYMQASQGISGGAVYDQNGVCIGMIIAGDGETLLALPVPIVFSEYYIF